MAVFAFVYWLAFFVRFDFEIPTQDFQVFTHTLPLVLGTKFVLFLLLGHFEGWWAYVTFADLIALIRTSVLTMLGIVAVTYLAGQTYFIPRIVLILDCGAAIALLGMLRGSRRLYREHFWPIFSQGEYRWALLVGTDHSNRVLAHQIQTSGELPYRIRGFLATEDTIPGARLGQIPCSADSRTCAKSASPARRPTCW